MLRIFLSATALFTLSLLMFGDPPQQMSEAQPSLTVAVALPEAPAHNVEPIPMIVPRDGWSIQLIVRDPLDESPAAPRLGCGAPCLMPHLPDELRGQ